MIIQTCSSGQAWTRDSLEHAIAESKEACYEERVGLVVPLAAAVILPGWWKLLAAPLYVYLQLHYFDFGRVHVCSSLNQYEKDLANLKAGRCTAKDTDATGPITVSNL